MQGPAPIVIFFSYRPEGVNAGGDNKYELFFQALTSLVGGARRQRLGEGGWFSFWGLSNGRDRIIRDRTKTKILL